MPQPFKQKEELHWHKFALLKRPELAARIGLIAAEWAALEGFLSFVFQHVLFPKSDAGVKMEFVATKAWEAMATIKAKLDFIDSIAKPALTPTQYGEWSKRISPEIRKRAIERNRIVHGEWWIAESHPDDLILKLSGLNASSGKAMRYTLKDLEDIANRIEETARELGRFWWLVENHLKANPRD